MFDQRSAWYIYHCQILIMLNLFYINTVICIKQVSDAVTASFSRIVGGFGDNLTLVSTWESTYA